MQMQHHFTVPVPVDVAWSALLDPERVAPCMPGATLSQAEGNEFAGSVKVKLGPISLLYKGTGSFTEIDTDARRVVIDASGKDSRGNGTAAATVTAVLSPATAADPGSADPGSTPPDGAGTAVTVDTDLKVTGKPAQLGRGLISEVGGKLLNQFAECLAERLAGGEAPAAASSMSDRRNGEHSAAATGGGNGEQTVSASSESRSTESRGPAAPVGRAPGWRLTAPANEDAVADIAAASSTAGEEPSDRADSVVTGKSVPSSEAIDLLGTARMPLLKRLAPVLAALAAVVVIVRLRRHRRR